MPVHLEIPRSPEVLDWIDAHSQIRAGQLIRFHDSTSTQGDSLMIYSVYKGEVRGEIVYIGTTIQKPADRFRWHKHNGKPFQFTVLSTHKDSDEMLAEELRLINKYKPKYNKKLKQNFNVKLTQEALNARKGSQEWCQGCLKRRVNTRYSHCMYCHRGTN